MDRKIYRDVDGSSVKKTGPDRSIALKGISLGPLKGVDLNIPLGRLVCFVGRHGSGCRTMAADVLYAESRRRYMLTLSPFERESLGGPGRIAVEGVSGLPPALFFDGMDSRPRETLAAFLQVDKALAQLLHKRGEVTCLECGGRCRSFGVEEALEEVVRFLEQGPGLVLAPLSLAEDASLSSVLQELFQAGFLRVRMGGKVLRLDGGENPGESLPEGARIEVVVDRLTPGSRRESRILEAIHNARAIARGRTLLVALKTGKKLEVNQQLTCDSCGAVYEDLGPDDFCGSGEGRQVLARQVSVAGMNIEELENLNLENLLRFLRRFEDPGHMVAAAVICLEEVCCLGLGYLRLSRNTEQLSSGEWKQLLLANCLSSRLAGILYIFEAPTAGLHGVGISLSIRALKQLVDQGNTVVAMDHTPSLLKAADEIVAFEDGLIGRADEAVLKGGSRPTSRHKRRRPGPELWIHSAGFLNLASFDLHLPLQCLVGITGPSGSGKSTLLNKVVAPALRGRSTRDSEGKRSVLVQGASRVRRVTEISGLRSGKGKPLLAGLELFDYLGKIFAATPAARQRNYPPEWFLLDSPGGRCTTCEGMGSLRHDLQFLEDFSLPCPACEGRRYRSEMLEITRRGLNVADVLELSVEQGRRHFDRDLPVATKLEAALSCGLGNCRLGMSSSLLERGEYLRLQLAVELARASPADLILLDNPAAGAHPEDLEQLVQALDEVVAKGASVMMEENSPELLAEADWLVVLGRESGARVDASIVATGPPEDVLSREDFAQNSRRSNPREG